MTTRQNLFHIGMLALMLQGCITTHTFSTAPVLDPKEVAGADAVILERKGTIAFLSDSDPKAGYQLKIEERIQVLTPGGRRYARVVIPIDYFEKLRAFRGATYYAEGATQGQRVGYRPHRTGTVSVPAISDGILYSDNKNYIAEFSAVQPGRIIHYEYVVESRQAFSLPRWFFQREIPVVQSSLTVRAPSDWEFLAAYRINGEVSEAKPKRGLDGSDQLLTWSDSNLKAFEFEPYSPPTQVLRKQLHIAVATGSQGAKGYKTWEDIADYYRQLTGSMDKPSEEVLAAFKKDTAKPGEDLKAQIFRFVRDHVRYVAVHEGIGGLKPHRPEAVFKNRWGDCKDMTTLLVSLYKHHGIDAFPVLVGTRGYDMFVDKIPSIGAFNHAIVALPQGKGQKTYDFVDATAKDNPYGNIPWALQGQDALVVKPEGSEVVEIPITQAPVNKRRTVWRLGQGKGMVTLTLGGAHADPWRYWLDRQDRAEFKKMLERRFLGIFEEPQLASATLKKTHTHTLELSISFTFRPQSLGNRQFWAMGDFMHTSGEVRVPKNRRAPVDLGFRSRKEIEVRIAMPKGAVATYLPKRLDVRTSLATMTQNASAYAGEVVVKQVYENKVSLAPPETLEQLRKMSETVAQANRDAVVITLPNGAGAQS